LKNSKRKKDKKRDKKNQIIFVFFLVALLGEDFLETFLGEDFLTGDFLGEGFLTIGFFLSQLTIINDMIKTRETEKVPYLMFLVTIYNCVFWSIYGFQLQEPPIWLCNGVGFFINIFTMVTYLYFVKPEKNEFLKYVGVLGVSIIGIIIIFSRFSANVNGFFAMILCICLYFTPLQKLREVIDLKDNSYISIKVSGILFLNCVTWTFYGILLGGDVPILVTNSCGVVLSIVQIYIWNKYKTEKGKAFDFLI